MTKERNRERSAPGKKNIFAEGSEIGKVISDAKKRMGENVFYTGLATRQCNYIETGVFLIDLALLGGFQESRVNMVYGWEASGKTTLVMRAVAAAQRKYPNKAVAWIDAEGTFDPEWAAMHGVDVDRLAYADPDTGEEAVDLIEGLLRSQETAAVILDSIPAIVPHSMIERSAEDKTMAVRASLMGVCCSKIIAALSSERKRQHNPTVILINQWRRKVGFTMGDNRILPGGDQVRYMCSVMLETKKKKGHTGKDKYDSEIATYNEHAFDLDKLKGRASITQGEFRMAVNGEYNMQQADQDAPDICLPAGTVDDFKVVASYAKRMGFLTGGGSRWELDGVDTPFRKISEVTRFFVEQPEQFTLLKRKMILLARTEKGLDMPPDGYLLGPTKQKITMRERSR